MTPEAHWIASLAESKRLSFTEIPPKKLAVEMSSLTVLTLSFHMYVCMPMCMYIHTQNTYTHMGGGWAGEKEGEMKKERKGSY